MSQARRIEYLPLDTLKAAQRNPKDHDIGSISTSINRFGYVEPIILDERTNRIVAGHGRIESLQALRKMGGKPPEGVKADNGAWLVPVVRGWASESDTAANAYLLASNRLTELGGWHQEGLKELLGELASQDALAGVGWDAEDLDKMLAANESKTVVFDVALKFQVIVDCQNEAEQAELLQRLEAEGLKCKPLML